MDAWRKPLQAWQREMQAGGLAPGTIRLRNTHLRQFAAHHPDGPASITRYHLIDWLARPRTPEYRRSMRSSLRTFFAWAEEDGLLSSRSPAARLPAVRAPRRQPHPAGEDVIIDALTIAPARTLLMIRMMAELGLRRAETAGADVDAIEYAGLRICGKGGVVRVVPLPRDLRSVLTGLPPGPVFPGRVAGHLSPDTVGRLVSAVLPAGVVPHQLRHAAATAWRRRGLSLEVIRDLLGHASVRTTEIYVMTDLDGAQEVVEQAAARLPMDSRRTVDARQAVAGYLAGRIDAAIDSADTPEDALAAVRAIVVDFVGSAAGERGRDRRDQTRGAGRQRAVDDESQPLRLVVTAPD